MQVESFRDNQGHVSAQKALTVNGWVAWAAFNSFLHTIWVACLLVCQLYQVWFQDDHHGTCITIVTFGRLFGWG